MCRNTADSRHSTGTDSTETQHTANTARGLSKETTAHSKHSRQGLSKENTADTRPYTAQTHTHAHAHSPRIQGSVEAHAQHRGCRRKTQHTANTARGLSKHSTGAVEGQQTADTWPYTRMHARSPRAQQTAQGLSKDTYTAHMVIARLTRVSRASGTTTR